jgi:hypothetical protein
VATARFAGTVHGLTRHRLRASFRRDGHRAGQVATPASASEHVKPTVTSVLFQPAALGAGAIEPTMTGAVLSSTNDRLVFCWPAPSVAVTVSR